MAQLTERTSLIASAVAAVGASVCCVGPLVLLMLGISGSWIGSLTAIEPFRPYLIGLTLLFLGSPMADLVPLIFGERFWAIFYDGVAIDPGSSKMRNALRRHLAANPVTIHAVTATHHDEEHSGNLEWLASWTGAELLLGLNRTFAVRPI